MRILITLLPIGAVVALELAYTHWIVTSEMRKRNFP